MRRASWLGQVLGATIFPRRPAPRQRWLIPLVERLETRLAPATGLSADNAQLLSNYGQVPLSFEVNVGQTASQVQYLAHGDGYALFLTPTGAVLSLQQPTTSVALALTLVGANSQAPVSGQELLPGTSNYFVGDDPSQWLTNIANYGAVAYQDVYPGVNLVYYGNQQQLEYDFVVAPGADPSSIRFAVQGADRIGLDDQGNLVLHTATGDVLEQAPVVYQEVGGVRQAVAGQFVLLSANQVGFQVGAYDSSLPLTIDPVLGYSTYLGGNGSDMGAGIAVDSAGNAYLTGTTTATNFPTTLGAFQSGLGASTGSAFVTKLNATGTAVLYSTYLGGSGGSGGGDDGRAIAVDNAGNAYITGSTASSNFPTTAGAFQTHFRSVTNSNAFLTKLNATGTALVYSTYLGGTGGDNGLAIALDNAGEAYVTGSTFSTNFPITIGSFQLHIAGSGSLPDAFVSKLNAAGTALVFSTYLGGSDIDVADGIAVDSAGDPYITGSTFSINFPTTAGALHISSGNGTGGSAFVTKLNASGSALIYSLYLGGSLADASAGIALDSAGDAYITGFTESSNFPTTSGAFQTNPASSGTGFVTKLNTTGTALIYSTYLGGSNSDNGAGIAVDSAGDAYVTGVAFSTNFPTTPGAFQTSLRTQAVDGANSFVTKLNPTGTALLYSTYLGGTGTDRAAGIALDSAGNVYVTGSTTSTNFPTTAGAFQTSLAGTSNAFVARFSFAPTHFQVSAPSAAPLGFPITFTVTALDAGNSVVSGYTGTVHFSSSDSQAVLPANVTLTNGAGSFSATLKTTGSQTLTATDTATPSLTGTSGAIQVVTPATISGLVFNDINLNGVQDDTEPGLAKQTVFLDLRNDGTLDPGDPSAVTDSNGAYTLNGVVPGSHALRQVLFGGVLLSTPASDSIAVTLTAGATLTGQNFADVPTSITVPLTLPPTTPFPSQGDANADYVEAVFRAVLNRNADSGGLAFWSSQLTNGTMTRVQVVDGIRNSPEHFAQEVDALYLSLLGRAADQGGQDFWVSQLQAGVREEQIAFQFLNSPEYLSKGDKFFVDAMYQSLLGRAFDPGGEQFWLNQLGDDSVGNPTHAASVTHQQVVNAFLFSQESLARLTEGYYQVFLQRQADPGGLNSWVQVLQQGLPFLTIGEEFIASDEFYNRAAANG